MNTHPNSNSVVPLTLVAAEVGLSADELAQRLGDAVAFDAVTGLRSISAQRCREYLTSHRAAQQAEADRLAAQREEQRKRLAELDARNRATIPKGIPATPGSTALADMIGADKR